MDGWSSSSYYFYRHQCIDFYYILIAIYLILLSHSNRTLLITRVIHPYGLTIYGNTVYWTDWVQGSIDMANKMTGSNRRTFAQNLEAVIDLHAHSGAEQLEDGGSGSIPLGLFILSNVISFPQTHCLERVTMATWLPWLPVTNKQPGLFVFVFAVFHPCVVNNGGCSDLCLSRPSPSAPGLLQASCICPGGRAVKEDGRTCNEGTYM